MARKPLAESKEAAIEMLAKTEELAQKELPTLTFSEAEVQKVADFINFMYLNAEFKGSMKDYKKINAMFSDMHNHVTKIEQYIFEFKRISAAKKAAE